MPVLNITTYIITSTTGLTKPGEILALYRLKSLSLAYKAKLKSPCFNYNNNNNNKTNAKHEFNDVKYEGY